MFTDEQLIERLIEGDSTSLDELYKRYAKKLYVFIEYSMRNRNPEDVVHEVFLKVIESARQFNPKKASFQTWIFRITRNHCIDLLRREQRIKFMSLEQKIGQKDSEKEILLKDTLAMDNSQMDFSLINESITQAVSGCIAELRKEEEREALVLYYMVGKVYREIGEIFGKSISMVKKHISAASEKVKRCLERKGMDSFS